MKSIATKMALRVVYGRWPRRRPLQEGYAIVVVCPEDMPFLLKYVLEGLPHMATENCHEILIVPDAMGDAGDSQLEELCSQWPDSRLRYVPARQIDRFLVPRMGHGAYWRALMAAFATTKCKHVFCHDADAFFLDPQAVEKQYAECRRRQMDALGVQARWDPFYQEIDYLIPGTWQCMYATDWAHKRPPYLYKGATLKTPHGSNCFDVMLYPEYLDYEAGRIGVTDLASKYVHVGGTVSTYRAYRRMGEPRVNDSLFRLLALALLNEVSDSTCPYLPKVSELANGLTDPKARITYNGPELPGHYSEFRKMIRRLGQVEIFSGDRLGQMDRLLSPFDKFFENKTVETPEQRLRTHGLEIIPG